MNHETPGKRKKQKHLVKLHLRPTRHDHKAKRQKINTLGRCPKPRWGESPPRPPICGGTFRISSITRRIKVFWFIADSCEKSSVVEKIKKENVKRLVRLHLRPTRHDLKAKRQKINTLGRCPKPRWGVTPQTPHMRGNLSTFVNYPAYEVFSPPIEICTIINLTQNHAFLGP